MKPCTRRGWVVVAASTAVLLAAGACNRDGSTTRPAAPVDTSATPGVTVTAQTPGPTSPLTPQPIPTGNPTKAPAGGAIKPAAVNNRDATAVAVAVVAMTFRHDTAIDNSPSDAQRRARYWLDPPLTAQLADGPVAAPGAQWNTWVKHRAYTTTTTAADATEYGAPADTATRADRAITVTVRPIGRDRWRGPAQRHALYVTMTRTNTTAPWRVSQLQVQE